MSDGILTPNSNYLGSLVSVLLPATYIITTVMAYEPFPKQLQLQIQKQIKTYLDKHSSLYSYRSGNVGSAVFIRRYVHRNYLAMLHSVTDSNGQVVQVWYFFQAIGRLAGSDTTPPAALTVPNPIQSNPIG